MDYFTRQLLLLLMKAIEQNQRIANNIQKNNEHQQKIQHEYFKNILSYHDKSKSNDSMNEQRNYGVHNSVRRAAWVTAIATILAVFAATWYACITRDMWKQMKITNKIATETFEGSSRAAISVVNVQKPSNITCPIERNASGICARIYFQNDGKSPAVGVQNIFHVATSITRQETTKTLPQFNPKGLRFMSVGDHSWEEPSEEQVCPPGAAGGECIDRNLATKMLHADVGMYIYGAIQYCDIFGGYHVTRYCFYQPSPHNSCREQDDKGCFGYCDYGNFMDASEDLQQIPPKQCKP